MKKLNCLIVVLIAAVLLMILPGAEGTSIVADLTILGDGVELEIFFSRADLEGFDSVIELHRYSVINNFPTERVEYASGVPLMYLLEQAGLKDSAQLITFTASDGYRRQFTVEELLYAPRYSFSTEGERTPVPVMIGLQSSRDGFDSLEDGELRLIMGQRAFSEQNNPWFVGLLQTIEVSTEAPEKWPEVTFDSVESSDGFTLELRHENMNSVKIYYTVDGSEPTVESIMYNISATHFQPELNTPLLIGETTVLKAIAVGPGRESSDISSITITVPFNDLDGFDWAKEAIELLSAEGIVAGVGNNSFDPAGSLTRGMFVTMLYRAEKSNSQFTIHNSQFVDVAEGTWYYDAVLWAAAAGITQGYPDGTFMPFGLLTVEEMIVLAVRARQLEVEPASDDPILIGVSAWAEPFVIAAERNGMLLRGHLAEETEEGIIVDGVSQANRAVAAVIVYSLLLIS